ncbi:DUF6397 family protein [Streptomyces sp. NPDC048182]|uniref:DUF6397 family protein n=1 Tax=Streptomyces sp. NPDC048182 TaxID=3365507 RepID=UPI00371038D1
MSGTTVIHQSAHEPALTPGRAAREIGLRRAEFDLAVHLGRIRTVPDEGGGGRRRVARAEIERIRAQEGFPEALRDSVRTVGTSEAAALMEVTAARFTRLARLGLLTPVTFYLNRYRAVVWLYLAEEARRFAADERNTALLTGRTPENLRRQLADGLDLRPRNWRSRRLGLLLHRVDDPWARAAAVAALLDPDEVADVVRDPGERARLDRFRPLPRSHGAPGSPAALLAAGIETASDTDEIDLLRADLAHAMDTARGRLPEPPTPPSPPAPRAVCAQAPAPVARDHPRRLQALVGRLRRRGRRAGG